MPNTTELAAKTKDLIEVLDQLVVTLQSDEEMHWSAWMKKAQTHLIKSDYYGVEYLLLAYGGMGSLNDLVLAQTYVNGVFAWKPGYVELNERFNMLRSKAWELAHSIKKAQC